MSKSIEIIEKEILNWPYVTAEPHRFGGTEFRLDKREMGHIHSEGLADIPFPMKIRDDLLTLDALNLITCSHNQDGLAIGFIILKKRMSQR